MKKRNTWKAIPMVALVALTLLSSCGKKTFEKLEYSSSAVAGQYVYIKPKLDLVIFQDDSDSMFNALGQLKPQLANFLTSLDTNWEYRVVVLPLLRSNLPMSSKFVIATDCSTVTGVGRCLSPSDANYFNSLSGDAAWIMTDNYQSGNSDYGFYYMTQNVSALNSSGFLRPDSFKAFMILSNGEDNTNVTYSYRPDGAIVGIDYNSSTTINSFNSYLNTFQGYKNSLHLSRLYSVVAANRYSDCWGGGMTFAGKRYMDLANYIGNDSSGQRVGVTVDLCNNGLPSVMSDLRSSLQTVVQTVVFNYVVISTTDEPDPSTIVIQKNGSTLPQSTSNGWEYVGMRTGYTSIYPFLGNTRTGYMVKLNGSATFQGTDTISIDFKKK